MNHNYILIHFRMTRKTLSLSTRGKQETKARELHVQMEISLALKGKK